MATITAPLPTSKEFTARVDPVECLPLVSELAIVAADIFALLLPASLLAARFGSGPGAWEYFLPISVILLVFFLFRLYPGIGLHPVTELRRFGSAAAAVVLASLTLTYKQPHRGRDLFVISVWAVGILLVPFFRSLLRQVCARRSWWGYPVFIVGDGYVARTVVTRLMKNPQLGLKPVALFDDFTSDCDQVSGVPVIESLDTIGPLAQTHGVKLAIIAMAGGMQQSAIDAIESKASNISHLLFVTDLGSPSCLEINTRDVSRMLAIEVPRNLLPPISRAVKRAIDLSLTLTAGILIAPLIALLCLLIKIDSRGPIFYGHIRVGRRRRPFKVWKFRSMVVDGDQILEKYLREHPDAAEEWKLTRKLKQDPRITKLGKFLRRSSLDELPQLWNVLRGEMSLVGPRPVVEAEAVKYGTRFSHYLQVSPGLTGMWQVSGRNDTSYEERVELDAYYVRNWSPWLDLYLIARTFVAVMRKEGAY